MEANDLFDDAKAHENSASLPRAVRVAAQVFALAAPLFCALFWNHVQKFEERIAGRAADANVVANARPTNLGDERALRQDAWKAQLDALYPDEETPRNANEAATYSALLENDELDFNAFTPDSEPESNLELLSDDALVDVAPFAAQNEDAVATPQETSLEPTPDPAATAAVQEPAATQSQNDGLTQTPAQESNEIVNVFSTPISEEEVFGVLEPAAANTEIAPESSNQVGEQTSTLAAQPDNVGGETPTAQEDANFAFDETIVNPLDSDLESLPLAPGQVDEFDERTPAPGAASALIQPQQTPNSVADETNLAVDNTIANDLLVNPLNPVNENVENQTQAPNSDNLEGTTANATNEAIADATGKSTTLEEIEPASRQSADASAREPETQEKATAESELEKIALPAEPGASAPSYFSRAASLFGGADAFSTYYFARTVDLVGEDLLFSPKSFSGAFEKLNAGTSGSETGNGGDQESEKVSGVGENNKAVDANNTTATTVESGAISQASYADREPGTGYIARDDATTHRANAVLPQPEEVNSVNLSPFPTDAAASANVVPTPTESLRHDAPNAANLTAPTSNGVGAASLTPGSTTALPETTTSQDPEYVKRLQAELRAEGIVSARVERWDATNWRASGVIASGASGGAEFLQGFGATARDATDQLRARRAASLSGDVRR